MRVLIDAIDASAFRMVKRVSDGYTLVDAQGKQLKQSQAVPGRIAGVHEMFITRSPVTALNSARRMIVNRLIEHVHDMASERNTVDGIDHDDILDPLL